MVKKVIIPTLDEIRAARQKLGRNIRTTPVWQAKGKPWDVLFSPDTALFLKMELWQYTGSFKPRGALTVMMNAPDMKNGVTAVSAGNHAIAVAYAAKILGTHAKVVMTKTASPARVALCKDYGAEVILAEDLKAAFEEVERIAKEEGRLFVHPFEGPYTALGTATLGLEFAEQVKDLDAVLVAMGGGGLCGGMGNAIKQIQPNCQIFGVEPVGANNMYLSLQSGKPETLDKIDTIADSLAPPQALPYSFSLCQQCVDEVVLVEDTAMCMGMTLLFHELKMAVEPACAAVIAAALGPLRERLLGKRVGLIMCGTNIDADHFCQYAKIGAATL